MRLRHCRPWIFAAHRDLLRTQRIPILHFLEPPITDSPAALQIGPYGRRVPLCAISPAVIQGGIACRFIAPLRALQSHGSGTEGASTGSGHYTNRNSACISCPCRNQQLSLVPRDPGAVRVRHRSCNCASLLLAWSKRLEVALGARDVGWKRGVDEASVVL